MKLFHRIRRCGYCRHEIKGEGYLYEGTMYCSRACRELGIYNRIMKNQCPWMVIAVVWILGLVMIYATSPARAHDIYTKPFWVQPDNGASCCDDKDCGPSRAFKGDDGLWRAWNGAEWVPVPPAKVMNKPSPDGRTHWCGVGSTTYCLLVGDTLF